MHKVKPYNTYLVYDDLIVRYEKRKVLIKFVSSKQTYYAFDIFQKAVFILLDALHSSKFANFCHGLMQNHLL